MNGIVFLLGLGGSEIILIFLVVLLLFGADKIPEFAKGVGKGMREFRKATEDIKREFETHTQDIKNDIEESTKAIESSVNEMSSSLDEDYGYTPYHEGSGNNDNPDYFLDPEEAELNETKKDPDSPAEKEEQKPEQEEKKQEEKNNTKDPEHPDPDFKS